MPMKSVLSSVPSDRSRPLAGARHGGETAVGLNRLSVSLFRAAPVSWTFNPTFSPAKTPRFYDPSDASASAPLLPSPACRNHGSFWTRRLSFLPPPGPPACHADHGHPL